MVRRTHAVALSIALAGGLAACGGNNPEFDPLPGGSGRTDNSALAPSSSDSVNNGGTMAVAPATSMATSTESDSTARPLAEGEIDPVGVWWAEVATPGSEVLPWLGNLTDAEIRFIIRVAVTGNAPNHQVEFKFCELQTEWTDPADPNNITTIGFRPDTVATFTETTTADLGGLGVGDKVPLPHMTFRGGVDEAGEEFDENGDGYPAVTAWVRTLLGLQIEVYEHITIDAALEVSAADENTLEGTVDFGAEALIISSNNPIIFAGTEVTITPDSMAVPVTATRLPGDADCDELPSTIMFTEVPAPPPALLPPAEPADADSTTGGTTTPPGMTAADMEPSALPVMSPDAGL